MSRPEFRAYQTTPKKAGGPPVTERIRDPFEKLRIDDDGDDDYALVVRRTYNKDFELQSTILSVNSPHLLGVFREVIGSTYTMVASDFKQSVDLQAPFMMLFHYWNELEQQRRGAEDSYVRLHLNLLFQFMEKEIGNDRIKLMEALTLGQINYLQAWAIFRPGELLFTRFLGHPWLLRCQKTSYEESAQRGPYMTIHCTYTDHDGTREGIAETKFHIFQKVSFDGDHPAFIADLPIFPRRFLKGVDELESKMRERGEKFLRRKGTHIQSYDGIATFLKDPPMSFFDDDVDRYRGVWLPFKESGRVILDRKTFQEERRALRVSIEFTDYETMLCPPYAIGYSVSRKTWCQYLVNNLSEVEWKQDAWKDLVLGDAQKNVLEALITSHKFADNARDQPEQKGKGLVILLHGSPGSGKTLTAEIAAESSRRGLITASLGELNRENRLSFFERELKRLLQYATMWRAIVLLDEADVFLESRESTSSTPDRNALVAIFLRELEYFSGIAFLTTNRLASFDLAMKSRIHLALGYNPPDVETRRQIWIKVLENIPEDELGIDDVDDALDFVLQQRLNGREIANAINTARTLARFQESKLHLKHIETVLEVREQFDKSLQRESRRLAGMTHTDTAGIGGSFIRQSSILAEDAEF